MSFFRAIEGVVKNKTIGTVPGGGGGDSSSGDDAVLALHFVF